MSVLTEQYQLHIEENIIQESVDNLEEAINNFGINTLDLYLTEEDTDTIDIPEIQSLDEDAMKKIGRFAHKLASAGAGAVKDGVSINVFAGKASVPIMAGAAAIAHAAGHPEHIHHIAAIGTAMHSMLTVMGAHDGAKDGWRAAKRSQKYADAAKRQSASAVKKARIKRTEDLYRDE